MSEPIEHRHTRQWPFFLLAIVCVTLFELALFGAYWAIEGSKEHGSIRREK